MVRKSIFIAVNIAVMALISFGSTPYCACCVDHGYYDIYRGRPTRADLDQLAEIGFSSQAELYMTSAGYDGVKGLGGIEADIESDASVGFDIVESFLGRTFTLKIKTPNGRRGTLALPLPSQMVRYRVDTHDGEEENRVNREVSLYKEIFLTGPSGSATGFLSSANAKPTTYTLVFQGRGNGCESPSDYTFWRLAIKGPKAKYEIMGKLKPEPNT